MREGDALGYERIDEGGIALIAPVVEPFVQCPDILAPEALDNENDHILPMHAIGHSGVDGGIDLGHLLVIVEVTGNHEYILADGAVERERRVEYECSLHGTVDVLIGIRDGDGAHGGGEASTDACHNKGCQGYEREQLRPLEVPPVITLLRQARLDIILVDSIRHKTEEHDENDVVEGLGEEDAEQVALVGKFLEHRGRRAPHGVSEVDGIDEIESQSQTVDDDEYPAADLVVGIGLLMKRQQHQDDVGDIRDEDG